VISSSQRPLPTPQTDIYAVSAIRTRDPSDEVVAQRTATGIGWKWYRVLKLED